MTLKRIKYVSRYALPLSGEEIAHLAQAAARKNARLGVTGVLMTSGGIFFQIIEGPPDAVDGLFAAIARDRRHTDVLLLSAEEGAKRRLFPDWGMAAMDLDAEAGDRLEPLKAILAAVLAQRQVMDNLSAALERAVWGAMAGARTK
jgi:hypothetical protein